MQLTTQFMCSGKVYVCIMAMDFVSFVHVLGLYIMCNQDIKIDIKIAQYALQ